MNMKISIKTAILIIFSFFYCLASNAQNERDSGKFFVNPYFGGTSVADTSPTISNAGELISTEVSTDIGFATGLGLGYSFTDNISALLGWEYKSNDSKSVINGVSFPGNYASNVISLSGIYSFDVPSKLKPYLGLGAAYIQEVDLDIETDEGEVSFSQSGDLGFQGFLGSTLELSKRWTLDGQFKYALFGDVDMDGETNPGDQVNDIDYNPVGLNIGLRFYF